MQTFYFCRFERSDQLKHVHWIQISVTCCLLWSYWLECIDTGMYLQEGESACACLCASSCSDHATIAMVDRSFSDSKQHPSCHGKVWAPGPKVCYHVSYCRRSAIALSPLAPVREWPALKSVRAFWFWLKTYLSETPTITHPVVLPPQHYHCVPSCSCVANRRMLVHVGSCLYSIVTTIHHTALSPPPITFASVWGNVI